MLMLTLPFKPYQTERGALSQRRQRLRIPHECCLCP